MLLSCFSCQSHVTCVFHLLLWAWYNLSGIEILPPVWSGSRQSENVWKVIVICTYANAEGDITLPCRFSPLLDQFMWLYTESRIVNAYRAFVSKWTVRHSRTPPQRAGYIVNACRAFREFVDSTTSVGTLPQRAGDIVNACRAFCEFVDSTTSVGHCHRGQVISSTHAVRYVSFVDSAIRGHFRSRERFHIVNVCLFPGWCPGCFSNQY